MNAPTIGSLITVPEVETVIRLEVADSEDNKSSRALLSSFVVTDEIEKALRQCLKQIDTKQGTAAFLRGNYGSGKSHFLAVLSLLLESTHLWQYLQHPVLQEFQQINSQKMLVVKIALHNFSAGESLETILFGTTEQVIRRRSGKTTLLRRGAVLVEHFNRYVIPQHPEFLEGNNLALAEWEKICGEQPQRAVQLAYSFITENQVPLKPVFDRREALNRLQQLLQEEEYNGVFWAVDELSEYLKAKPSPAAFAEDLRFLQFLGEACTSDDNSGKLPLYLIAALQENIEKTGYIEKDLVYRIKDRFPLRFSLSAHHVNQLIARRLIHKKPQAVPQIRKIYQDFVAAFRKAEIGEQEFTDIYPVHPDTVQLLEGLTPIFSQHRGVVDFIYHQLRGDPNRNWQGMLQLPAQQLMTPDTIFDHFQDRLREIPDLAPYVDVVFQTLKKDIDHLFESPQDQTIALQTVKILILIELNLLEKHATVQRLAQMLNQPVSDLDESLNYSYLEEVILEKLVREGSFIAKEKLDSGESAYFISMEMTVHQMVRNRVREYFKQPVEIERELPQFFSYLQHSPIPLATLVNAKRRKYSFNWQNTNREGWVVFKTQPQFDSSEWEELNRDLQTSERDFVLFIIGSSKSAASQPPSFVTGLFEGSFTQTVHAWIPRLLQTIEIEFLQQFRAYEKVKQELEGKASSQEKQMRQIVMEWLDSHQTELTSIIEDTYFHGRICDVHGWRDFQFAPFYPDFKSILKQVFSPVLQHVFPRHSEIMPGDLMPPFVTERLFIQFIKPGGVTREEARSQNIDKLIENYIKPLGLVSTGGNKFTIDLSTKGNELLSHCLNLSSGENPINLYSLYWQLRKGDWGLTRGSFQLLLSALLSAGRLTAFQSGNVVPFHSINQLSDDCIDAVGEGKLISEIVQQALLPFFKLNSFSEIAPHFSVSTQEQFWRLLKEFRNQVYGLLQKWQMLERRYESYPAFKLVYNQDDLDLLLLQEFCEKIRVSYPARQGLEKLVEEIGAVRTQQIPNLFIRLQNITEVVENRFVEVNQIYMYLQHPAFEKAASQMKSMVKESETILFMLRENEFSEESQINDLTQHFYQFRSEYAHHYAEQHRAYYANEIFSQARSLETEPIIQVLKRMHRLEAIACSPDWITVQERMSALPKPCRRQPENQLANTPVCECDFIPGQDAPQMPLQEITSMAVEGVSSGLTLLQSSFRWILEDYAVKLREIGKADVANILSSLLEFAPQQVEGKASQLLSLLSEDVIREINAAIRGKVLILQRSIKKLQKRLSGKQLPLRQVRKIVEEWLTDGESVPDDTFVHVLSEQEMPELDLQRYRTFQQNIREEGTRFLQAFWLLAWALFHKEDSLLEWVKNRFRFHKIDEDVVKKTAVKGLEAGETERIAAYLQRAGILEQLSQLIDLPRKNVEELLQFIRNEIFWEALSVQASRQFLSKVAPTETLPQPLAEFVTDISQHSRQSQWLHLSFIERFLQTIQTAATGENVDNPVAFYLEDGWRLPLLMDALIDGNRSLHLIEEERIRSLQKRIDAIKRQLSFPQQRMTKKEISVPYWDIRNMPVRIQNEIQTPVVVLIVDAMRWDVWQTLQPLFAQWLAPRAMVVYTAMETASPTTTEVNRPILLENIIENAVAVNWHLETVAEKTANTQSIIERIENRERLIFLNTTLLDTPLHEREESLRTMLGVLKTRMQSSIAPILQQIPVDVNVIVTSDHGFVKVEKGYTHGGDTFFEKIVPFTIWREEREQ